MCLFIESINYLEGQPQLLDWHQKRVNDTFAHFFSDFIPHDLKILLPTIPDMNQHKCRILYDGESLEVDFMVYTRAAIKSLKVVEEEAIDYTFKAEDRSALTRCYEQRGRADDVVIVKSGALTDSYFANLAFFDGREWWTPETYLLNGVMRQYLLYTGQLKECAIGLGDLKKYKKVSLINAMNTLGQIEIDCEQISL